jgi:hypothetical protein
MAEMRSCCGIVVSRAHARFATAAMTNLLKLEVRMLANHLLITSLEDL